MTRDIAVNLEKEVPVAEVLTNTPEQPLNFVVPLLATLSVCEGKEL